MYYCRVIEDGSGQNNVIAEDRYYYNAGTQVPAGHVEYEHDGKMNPLENKWVMPFGASRNNITKMIVTNFITAPGSTTSANTIVITYKRDTAKGYPAVVNEYGEDSFYEYE